MIGDEADTFWNEEWDGWLDDNFRIPEPEVEDLGIPGIEEGVACIPEFGYCFGDQLAYSNEPEQSHSSSIQEMNRDIWDLTMLDN